MLRKYKCGCIGLFHVFESDNVNKYKRFLSLKLIRECGKSRMYFLRLNPEKHCTRGEVAHEDQLTELEMAIYYDIT